MIPATTGVRAGIRITFIGTVLTGMLQFGLMMVLARLLTPAAYGAYALCVAISSLSVLFVLNVMERSLIVEDARSERTDDTAMILLLALGSASIALAVAFGLNQVRASVIDPALLAVTLLSNVIGAAAITPRVSMRRQLLFTAIVRSELTSLVLGAGLVTVTLAVAGWSSYALACGLIVQNTVLVGMLRFNHQSSTGWSRPSWTQATGFVRLMAGVGWTSAAEIANAQVAPLVLATRLGVAALGLFNRTYSLVQIPIQLLTSSMSRVMVSALFAMRDDPARFRASLRTLVQVAGVIVAPVAAGIAGTNETFILLAFGRKWLSSRHFLPWLALGAWAVMMATLYGIALEALRAFAVKTRTQLVSTAALISLSLAGTWFGLVGAVAGIAISGCLLLLLTARAAARQIGASLSEALGWLTPGLLVAAPCLLLAWAIGHCAQKLSVPILFLLQVGACGMTQAVGLLLLYPAIALKLIEGAAPTALRIPPLARYLAAKNGAGLS